MSLVYGINYKYRATVTLCEICGKRDAIVDFFDWEDSSLGTGPIWTSSRCTWCLPSNYLTNAVTVNRVRFHNVKYIESY